MALEATHIRFAVDVKEKVGAEDLQKYISGTIYPDSRYVTGIDRRLTHTDDCISQFLAGDDDFRKGWAVHLVCDNVQATLLRERFAEIYEKLKIAQNNDTWVSISALKGMLDMDDVRRYLPYLEYVENPNGEDLTVLQGYNRGIQGVYEGAALYALESRVAMWNTLGLEEKLLHAIHDRMVQFQKDESIIRRLQGMYGEMLDRGLSML